MAQRLNWTALRKVVLVAVSLFFFILAILLMKEGANGLGPLVRDTFHVTDAANALGFGWVFAYLVMSGSPVAAAALTLLDAGILNELSAFTMIVGSRLGASFFVLLIGFIYVLRGRNRATSLGMGLLALIVTGFTQMIALPIGVLLLHIGLLAHPPTNGGFCAVSFIDAVFGPILAVVLRVLPEWSLFPAGLVIILVSFSLFDRGLPHIHVGEGQMGRMSSLVFRPWVMFVLGALVTLLTLSVSVSLSILVPLNHRCYIRRENVVPYIMGAGITTFVDTLLAALLLNNPAALNVVLVQMLSVTIVSVLFISICFSSFERLSLQIADWVSATTLHLAVFVLIIVFVPLILMLV